MRRLLSPFFCPVAELEADEERREVAAGGGYGVGLDSWNFYCL